MKERRENNSGLEAALKYYNEFWANELGCLNPGSIARNRVFHFPPGQTGIE